MFGIEIDSTDVEKRLAALREQAQDFSAPLAEFALWKERQLKNNFSKQIDPDGNPWEPLADSTLDDKRRRGAPLDILTDTATLKSGIEAMPATRDEAGVASTAGAEYGILHQKGTQRLPQRRYMGWSPGDADVAIGFIERHLGF